MQTLEDRFGRDELLHPKERKLSHADLSAFFDGRPHLPEPRLGELVVVSIGFPIAILAAIALLFYAGRKAKAALSNVEIDRSAKLQLNLVQRLLAGSVGIGVLLAQAFAIAESGGISGYGWAISISISSAFLLLSIHGLKRK